MDDRGAIENLLYRYAELIDAGDYAGIGELFAHGSIADEDGTALATGAEAVARLYTATTRRYPDGTPRSHHVITNPIVELSDDRLRASCRARFTVFQQTEELPLQPIITGGYVDSFEKVDGSWRYLEKRMGPRLFGDLSQHLLIEVAES